MILCFYINKTSFLNSCGCGISGLYKDLPTALERTIWGVFPLLNVAFLFAEYNIKNFYIIIFSSRTVCL